MHVPIKLEHLTLFPHNASTLLPSSRLGFLLFRGQILPQISAGGGGYVFIAAIPHRKMKLVTEEPLLFQARTFEYLSKNVSWGTTIGR